MSMTNYNPLVSIVIPVYNGANYMRTAIDSALNQTYDNIEIIVVNDGSTDKGETEKIAKSYGAAIRYFKKENGGCASALNYGISKMNGEWFSWLSHDDCYKADKVLNSIKVAANHSLIDGNTLVYCNSDLINEAGEKIFHPVSFRKKNMYDSIEFFKSLLFDASLNGCALLIPKNVLDEVGCFDENFVYIPDFDYWLRAAEKGFSLYCFNEVLCSNRVHSKQVSVLAKNRRRTDVESDIVKISELLRNNKGESQIEMVRMLWVYAYSRNYSKGFKKINEIANHLGAITFSTRILGLKTKIAHALKAGIKVIYKKLFKKGMD